MQLDGKVFNILLSTTNNVVLVDLKTMITSCIGKTLNPTSTATPSNPKFIIEHYKTYWKGTIGGANLEYCVMTICVLVIAYSVLW